jgi:RNA polymerase sigma-70 factor (ECF subfamily)
LQAEEEMLKMKSKDVAPEELDSAKNFETNRCDHGKNSTNDEQTLLKLLKEGNEEGLKRIMQEYHGRLFSVANKICRNPADTDEVLQDVYWIAFRKIDRFQGRSALATWLYRITVNASLMKLRSQKKNRNTVSRENLTTLPGEEESELRLTEKERSPVESLMSKELYETIWGSVEKLSEINQDVFFLCDIQGFSIQETSLLLKTTPAAIKSRSHRSRIFIKKDVGHYLHEN